MSDDSQWAPETVAGRVGRPQGAPPSCRLHAHASKLS